MEEDTGQGPASKNLLEPPTTASTEDMDEDSDDDGGFTFPVPAADVFADGRMGPVYPVFGRPPSPPTPETATAPVPLGRLLLEERSLWAAARPPEGGGDDELVGVPPETYCLWAPGSSAPASPGRCRKSGSTGSVLRWRRISERLVGRSHSDGKEKFVFLDTSSDSKESDDGSKGGGQEWRYHGKGAAAGSGRGRGRRSYLPYKQELVGLFANVSGLRRSYHPF